MARKTILLSFILALSMMIGCSGDSSEGDRRGDAPGDKTGDSHRHPGGDDTGDSSGSPGDTTGGDRRGDTTGTLSDTGLVFLDACTSLPSPCADNPSADCGKCQYRVFVGANCTAAAPCDDLLLYWANRGCDAIKVEDFATELIGSEPDLVIACVQPMFPGEMLPASMGAPERDNLVVTEVYGRLRPGGDLGVWSGANMLTAGCSAGASRAAVVAARTNGEDGWLGTAKNAACLSEGVVTIHEQDRFIGEGVTLGGSTCASRHQRVASAYTFASAGPGHSCTASPNGQCACDPNHATRLYPGTCGNGDCLEHDSIMVSADGGGFRLADAITPAEFTIPSWRVITEGGAHVNDDQRCTFDTVPREPFEALCAALDADAAHSCGSLARPNAPHCGYFNDYFATACLAWFRSL